MIETVEQALTERLVTTHFGTSGADLLIGGITARALVEAYGSPLFVYDGDAIVRRYRALTEALAGFARVYYSIKANPNPEVARLLVGCGAGLEVASGAEFMLARRAGAEPGHILFAGPGKSAAEIDLAVGSGIGEIHLETFEEIGRVAASAARHGRQMPVAIRVNPAPAAQGGAMRMGGKPSAFGFDEEQLADVIAAVARHARLSLSGLHLFVGTQILSGDVLLSQWAYGLELARRTSMQLGRPLARIDLGGGLGIPYHPGDATLDLDLIATGKAQLMAMVRDEPLLRDAEILIEPGRYLVGPAGVYLMGVNAVKHSRGQRFLVMDGGMHHHLAASGNLGQVVKRDFPLVAATRMDASERVSANVVGPLCTPLDTLGRQTTLPELAEGDLIGVLQSGAYGLSTSPVGFLSHPTPAEVLVQGGAHRLIRARGSFDTPLVST